MTYFAYCVKDKRKVEIRHAQRITMKNGRPAIVGTCPVCGNKVFNIGVRALPDLDETRCPGCRRPEGWPHKKGCEFGTSSLES